MPNNTSLRAARRRLLSTLIAGGTAGVAAHSLPAFWVKPLVDSVILPAHASTSAVEDCGPDIIRCEPLSIPGIEFSCANQPTASSTFYQVDDTSCDCPILLSFSEQPPEPDIKIVLVQNQVFGSPQAGRNTVIGGQGLTHYITNCGSTPGDGINAGERSETFQALSGATWRATYTVSGDVNGVTITDTILAPD